MEGTLVDSNVLLDILTDDSTWAEWSASAMRACHERAPLFINPIVYGEVSVSFATIEDLEAQFPAEKFRRLGLPFEAAFLAGKAFLVYRRRGGSKPSILPDFLIGAHASVARLRLLTRDPIPYRAYFPSLELIAP